ncbi:MAG TPA: sigma 54-interacting transcriptional regulator [Myxococcaceae bacterium]
MRTGTSVGGWAKETTLEVRKPRHAGAAAVDLLPTGPLPRSVRIVRAGTKELVLTLYPDRPLLLGRGPQCNAVIPSAAISREHARLWMREDGYWVIRDLGSRNGSYLLRGPRAGESEPPGGGVPALIVRDTPLASGDVVILAEGECRLLMESAAVDSSEPSLSTQSAAARSLEEAVRICARHRLAVFLIGPSGSGKTHVARFIHEAARMPGQFILVNCGRLPLDPVPLQSELLGHLRGAFTGAVADRVGKFHAADGGTLFLDEVEHLPPAAQDFLIDLLDGSGSFAPLGAPATRRWAPPNVRIIAASKEPLAQSRLRADLCHRLAAADVVALPTLEQRRDDIPGLVEDFLRQYGRQQAVRLEVEPDAVEMLRRLPWPGQVRELETVVKVTAAREHARLPEGKYGEGTVVITVAALQTHLEHRQMVFGTSRPAPSPPPATPTVPLESPPPRPPKGARHLVAEDVRAALERHGGNKAHAARDLRISVNTLKTKMRLFGLLAD